MLQVQGIIEQISQLVQLEHLHHQYPDHNKYSLQLHQLLEQEAVH